MAFALGVGHTDASSADNAQAAIHAVADLARRVGMTARLDSFGVTPAELPSLAADTLADSVTANNPIEPTADDIIPILEAAL